MDTIKKVLHPKEPTHQTEDTHDPTSTHQHHTPLPPDAYPDQQTLDRLGSEPNVTGTNRPPPREDFPPVHKDNTSGAAAADQPKVNRGHHHPRQPVGVTGPPAGHAGSETAAADPGAEAGARDVKAQAQAGNNFPGTNPHPEHSA